MGRKRESLKEMKLRIIKEEEAIFVNIASKLTKKQISKAWDDTVHFTKHQILFRTFNDEERKYRPSFAGLFQKYKWKEMPFEVRKRILKSNYKYVYPKSKAKGYLFEFFEEKHQRRLELNRKIMKKIKF